MMSQYEAFIIVLITGANIIQPPGGSSVSGSSTGVEM